MIEDKQIYEAAKEIMVETMRGVNNWNIDEFDRFSRHAARSAKIMADEIDSDGVDGYGHEKARRVKDEDR
tara:strand:+ start:2383 stop:2592 length:210 start_codon:yes stop_codon:yes gene_type:complete